MSINSHSIPNFVNTYKTKLWVHLTNIFTLIFMVIIFGPTLALILVLLVSIFKSDPKLGPANIFFLFLLVPIIFLIGFIFIQLLVSIISTFFSYIKVSSTGIEQRIWPSKHIRCNWSDIDKLGKILLFHDTIYLNSYEVLGLSLSLKSPFKLLRPKQGFISLTGYEGWPDGQLANDLKQYAPKLFENQPIPQETQAENKEALVVETALMSQEVRLLAAISHASMLLPNIGFFVPIGIYLTQKKKSSYLGFQALQALIWQFIMILFTMLTSSCLVGSMFIPLLLSTALQDERLLNLSSGGVFIAIAINVLFMTIGSLAFTLYSIIGAVMTYQGKDFRYPFLGNRIEKKIK